MAWIEIIHIGSHSFPDREKAIEAFRQLKETLWPGALADIRLLRSHVWEGDLSIFLQWRGKPDKGIKSPLGLQLAQAFSQFGQIHHSVWFQEIRLKTNPKETS